MTVAPPQSTAGPRTLHAPTGSRISCKGWHQEAALRMLHNNLDPDVAEDPDRLIVYGGTGKAARSWPDRGYWQSLGGTAVSAESLRIRLYQYPDWESGV